MTEMNEIRRLPKWDSKKMRTSKRITRRDQAAILHAYEKAMGRGESRDDILAKLAQRYGRSNRQIERYIQQARKEGEGKREEQTSPVLVTDDMSRARMLHSEAIKEAISMWVEKQGPPSDEELAGAWKGKLNAWGVIAEVTADGHGSAAPAMGKHRLYGSLRQHLVPPVVKEDFWEKIGELINLGLGFLSGAVSARSELSKAAAERSGFGIVTESWQNEPVTGITRDFVQTLYEHALGITDLSRWTHSTWAGLWPMTGGLIVTWANEGVRLLRGLGYEPSVQETYWPLSGEWMLPRHPQERIAYGDANLNDLCRVAFLLCFGTRVIATATFPEELALLQEAHRAMLADCVSGQRASSLRRVRERLGSLSQEVRMALEFARCETSFPGKCTLCP
jgi:hypothetical protein